MSSAPMIRAARLGAVFAVMCVGVLLSAMPAHAGGPTSALLVAPSTGHTASIYYSDPEYDRLFTELGGYDVAPDPTLVQPPGSDVLAPGAAYVTVTWLIHDVSVWRIDRIFLAADGPLIVTQTSDEMGEVSAVGMYPGETGNGSAVWHRPPDPTELQAVLAALGLLEPAQNAVQVGGSDAVDGANGAGNAAGTERITASDIETTAAASPVVDPADRAGVIWWWALGGLVAGIVLTAAVVRLVPSVRRRVVSRDDVDQPVRMVEIPI
jgi:hypothetical protein